MTSLTCSGFCQSSTSQTVILFSSLDLLNAGLSEAIMNGKQEQAVEIVKKLTSEKVNLSIKLKNPNLVTMEAGGNTIT